MELKEEGFWKELRRSVDRAKAREAAEIDELAAAERLLAEVVDAEPIPEERIEEMVRGAVSEDAVSEDAVAEGAVSDGAAQSRPTGWLPRLRKLAAAAAAFAIAPKFVIAATAVTAVAVTTVMVQYSTQTLPYQEAVDLMMDETQTEASRRVGLVRVLREIDDSIRIVQEAASDLGPQAEAVLDRLRLILEEEPPPFEPIPFPDPHIYLGDLVADRNLALEERRDALNRLADQLAYGLQALRSIEIAEGAPGLGQQSAVALAQLADRLSQ